MVPESKDTRVDAGGSAPDGGGDAGRGDGLPVTGDVSVADGRVPELDGTVPPGDASQNGDTAALQSTWKEHWFEHDKVVTIGSRDAHVVLYFDDKVKREDTGWLFPFVSKLWGYTKAMYGHPGDSQLHVVLHEGSYPGGHSSNVFSPSHDHRNVIDYGVAPGEWAGMNQAEWIARLAGIILESASLGVDASPSTALSGYEFRNIYAYDALRAAGFTAAAERLYEAAVNASTSSPHAPTYWFRDWYFPLWKMGGAQLFSSYFQLLFKQFPKAARPEGSGLKYARSMNLGEYVHFMSGAAGGNLKSIATTAFGWTPENETQLVAAKAEFPGITYPLSPPHPPIPREGTVGK